MCMLRSAGSTHNTLSVFTVNDVFMLTNQTVTSANRLNKDREYVGIHLQHPVTSRCDTNHTGLLKVNCTVNFHLSCVVTTIHYY